MYWLMICRHKPDCEAQKAPLRAAHREHVATGGGGALKVLIGSALGGADDPEVSGNFGILEASSRETVLDFARQDPFARAGLVESIDVIGLPDRFQAHRIDPMTR